MLRSSWPPALLIALFALVSCARGPRDGPGEIVRVGYFPNLTHAQLLAGIARGDYACALGPGVTIETSVFNAGPSVIEAMMAGRLDLACIGPNPAINGYVQSSGTVLRVVAGATSAGAAFVVRPDAGIASPSDLGGKRLATPQLGNTQDVALRAFLVTHGLQTKEAGGSVEVIPTPNPQILDLIRLKRLDGAWVPEPWASRLVVEAGCVILVDERDLWPRGDFVTAHIIVRKDYLDSHRELVGRWIDAHVGVTRWLQENPDTALSVINEEIERLTGKPLSRDVLTQSWSHMRPTWDPIAPSLFASARAAHAAGFLSTAEGLEGIYDLSLLNDVLRRRGLPAVTAEGAEGSP